VAQSFSSANSLAAQVGSIRPPLTIDDGSVAVTDNYLKLRIGGGFRRNERVIVRVLGDADPMPGEVVGPAKAGTPRQLSHSHGRGVRLQADPSINAAAR
jgi:hypothetical protein